MRRTIDRLKREFGYYRALLTHPDTPWISRALLGAAIAYFASPIDLIPDFIPILGQLDDLLIVTGLIRAALAFIPSGVRTECRDKMARKIPGDCVGRKSAGMSGNPGHGGMT